jgi:hypothetical protein
MSIKWKLNYGLAAVVAAIVVIGVALVTNPILINPSVPDPIFTGSSFLVMLTDPPKSNFSYPKRVVYTIF